MTKTSVNPLQDFIKQISGATFVASVLFPFEPVPASRPRVTRWGVYYGKKYTAWRKLAEAHLTVGSTGLEDRQALLVIVESVVTKAKSSKLAYPGPDTDNFAKGPLDAITKVTGYWQDDKQVVKLVSTKRFANPGEENFAGVHIYKI